MAYDSHLRHAYVLVVQSYLILCDPMDCSPPGSPVPGILLARAGCHSHSRGIFPIRGSKPGFLRLLHWQVDSLPGKPPSIKSVTDISWKCLHLIKTLISVRNTQGGTKLCMFLSVGRGAQAWAESRRADGSLVVARVRRVTWEVCGGRRKQGQASQESGSRKCGRFRREQKQEDPWEAGGKSVSQAAHTDIDSEGIYGGVSWLLFLRVSSVRREWGARAAGGGREVCVATLTVGWDEHGVYFPKWPIRR